MGHINIDIFSGRVQIGIEEGSQTLYDPEPEVARFAFKKLVSSLNADQLSYLRDAIYGVD